MGAAAGKSRYIAISRLQSGQEPSNKTALQSGGRVASVGSCAGVKACSCVHRVLINDSLGLYVTVVNDGAFVVEADVLGCVHIQFVPFNAEVGQRQAVLPDVPLQLYQDMR